MKTWIVSSLGCGNYSRVETHQGKKLFAEIRYVNKDTRLLSLNFEKYPHFSVMSQQVFFFSGSLKVSTNQDLCPIHQDSSLGSETS